MDSKMGSQPAAFVLSFPKNVYSLDVIKKAAYKFSDRASFDFESNDDQIFCNVVLAAKDLTITDFTFAFKNEVLDQDLRESIAIETTPMRNAVLAHAFSKTGLQSNE